MDFVRRVGSYTDGFSCAASVGYREIVGGDREAKGRVLVEFTRLPIYMRLRGPPPPGYTIPRFQRAS